MELVNQALEYLRSAEFFEWVLSSAGNIVIALAILIFGRWFAKATAAIIRKALNRNDVSPMLVTFLGNVVYAGLLVTVIFMSVSQLGVDTTSAFAIFGAAGLAIGLALKDSLSNFAAGVMIVLFRPFKLGDVVEVGGVTGKVQEIRIFSTRLNTGDNISITIPNGNIVSDTISNYTQNSERRIDIVMGVGYDDDLKVAREVMTRICSDHPKVLDTPETGIFVSELADSSVNFAVRPWVKTEDYWSVRADILEQCKVQLEAVGCSIPYPQSDVHLHKVN